MSRVWRRGLLVAALAASVLGLASSAGAAIIQVNTPADEMTPGDGSCSLREAISDVNTPGSQGDCGIPGGGTNTIELGAGLYRLTIPAGSPDSNATGDLDVTGNVSNLTIEGVGIGPTDAQVTEIVASGNGDRVLDVDAGAGVTLSDLAVTGGHASAGVTGDSSGNGNGGAGDSGGGINNAGSMDLSRVVVADDHAGDGGDGADAFPAGRGGDGGNGGGILNSGTLTVSDSTIEDDTAGKGGNGASDSNGAGRGGAGGDGGGISNAGTLTLTDTTVSQNISGAGGHGGQGGGGGNGAQGGSGGGIFTGLAALAATNVTIAGNIAAPGGAGGDGEIVPGAGGKGGSGGGLAALLGASLVNATVSDNGTGAGGTGGSFLGGGAPGANGQPGSGGGLDETTGSCGGVCTRLENSIVAENGGGNCSGSIIDGLHNLVFGDTTCPGTNADPKLGQLLNHGGLTTTMALLPGSAAIDAVPATGADCPRSDQRGAARPQGPGCDIGAYEIAPPVLTGESGGATGTTTAAVTATVNPNLQETTVTVRYGATQAYSSTSAAMSAGSGSTPVAVNVPLTGLSPATTYHAQLVATNGDGSATSSDLTFTTPAAGGTSPTTSPSAPVLSGVRQSARRWLEGAGLASISARRRPPVGTTFSFALNERATVRLAFTQALRGRRVTGGCVAPTRRNRHKPGCRVIETRGALTFTGHAGVNRIRFFGLLARGRRLKPGTYTVVIIAATPGAPPSAPAKLTFTIVRRTR